METSILTESIRALVLRVGASQGDSVRWHPLLTEVPAMCIVATMGYEAYLRIDGRVLVANGIGFEPSDAELLHVGSFAESAGALNMAARSRYPELSALVPARPEHAQSCEACGGSGVTIVAPSHPDCPIYCSVCHSLGWHPSVTS